MNPRFITNIALALVGAALVVATQAFSSEVTGWLTFGAALGVLTLAGVAQLDARRGPVQRSLDTGAGAIALWAAVASVVFTGTALVWLSFSEGLGFAGLALIGLVAHELAHEHVVHDVQAIPSDARASARKEELSAAA